MADLPRPGAGAGEISDLLVEDREFQPPDEGCLHLRHQRAGRARVNRSRQMLDSCMYGRTIGNASNPLGATKSWRMRWYGFLK